MICRILVSKIHYIFQKVSLSMQAASTGQLAPLAFEIQVPDCVFQATLKRVIVSIAATGVPVTMTELMQTSTLTTSFQGTVDVFTGTTPLLPAPVIDGFLATICATTFPSGIVPGILGLKVKGDTFQVALLLAGAAVTVACQVPVVAYAFIGGGNTGFRQSIPLSLGQTLQQPLFVNQPCCPTTGGRRLLQAVGQIDNLCPLSAQCPSADQLDPEGGYVCPVFYTSDIGSGNDNLCCILYVFKATPCTGNDFCTTCDLSQFCPNAKPFLR